jgi:two-component system sensor histidine kinase RegB
LNERLRINVSWLLKLRWAAVLGQLATVLVVGIGLNANLPIIPLFSIIALAAVTNLLFEVWYRQVERVRGWERWGVWGHRLVDGVMTVDILLLSLMLFFTGGINNPFCVFFLVNLALAAVVVEPRGIWVIGALNVVSLLVLSVYYAPLPILMASTESASFTGWLTVSREGQLVAFTAATVAIAYFNARLTLEVRERDTALEAARQRESRRERLESLATLAAGAAHELATPLSTIAVVARELERHLHASNAGEDCLADAQLIRTELAQCRTILDRMAGRAGESVGEGMTELTVAQIVEEMLTGLPGTDRVSLEYRGDRSALLILPRVAVGQALRGIVKNALDAAGREGRVRVRAGIETSRVVLEIVDNGPGMSSETLARVGEPFFTTKQPGEGTGLGLFLARAVIDRLGGHFELRSQAGQGTTAEITLPRTTEPSVEGKPRSLGSSVASGVGPV